MKSEKGGQMVAFFLYYIMGGSGSVSAMITSLRLNNRREKRTQFDMKFGFDIEKTEYDFPEVSKEKREEVVKIVLKKRRLSEFLYQGVFILLIGFLLLFLVQVIIVLIP